MKLLAVSDYSDTQSARPEAAWMIGLHQAGIDVEVITYPNSELSQNFSTAGITVIEKHPSKKWDHSFTKWLNLKLSNEHIDFLILFNSIAITNGIRAAKGTTTKVILYRGYAGHVHWYDPTAYFKYLHPRVHRVVCVSEAVRSDLVSNSFIPPSRAVTIHKGHDPSWYESVRPHDLSEFNIPANSIVLVCLANVRKFKGLHYLLKSLSLLTDLSNLHVLLIGRGMDSGEMLRWREKTGMAQRIHATGFRQDVLSLMVACDLFVLPSIFGEGLSKAALEAMNLGLPVITTSIPANKELMPVSTPDDLLVPPRDSVSLASAIRNLVTNQERRRQWGKVLRSHVQHRFHIERTIKETLDLLESEALLNRK